MKILLGWILIMPICMLFVGCAQAGVMSSEDVESESAAVSMETIYEWKGIPLQYAGITDNVEAELGMQSPSGKYVVVSLAIVEGRIDFSEFMKDEDVTCLLKCGGNEYVPITVQAKGVSIEGEMLYAVGTLEIYFDLPADTDISAAEFTMVESQ